MKNLLNFNKFLNEMSMFWLNKERERLGSIRPNNYGTYLNGFGSRTMPSGLMILLITILPFTNHLNV